STVFPYTTLFRSAGGGPGRDAGGAGGTNRGPGTALIQEAVIQYGRVENMAGESGLTPTSYIQHHLRNLTAQVGEGSFFTIHVDTLVASVAMGLFMVFIFWLATRNATAGVPGKWQALVEMMLEFVDRQARD